MGTYAARLTKAVGDHLGDEALLAAIKCFAEGHTSRKMKGSLFGAIGAVAAMSGSQDGHAIAGEALPKEIALGLTPTRLFVFGLSTMTGKATTPPKAVVAREEIVSIESESARTFGVKQLKLTISFLDGSTLTVESAKGFLDEAQHLVDALQPQ
jgi:hypothetical protein